MPPLLKDPICFSVEMGATVCCNRSFFLLLVGSTFLAFMTYILHDSRFINGIQNRQPTNNEKNRHLTKCKPLNNIFFLKTHKTGSSTLAVILYRYGDNMNLTFVLPKKPVDFNWPERFHLSNTIPLYAEEGKILCSHTRYNKGPVNLLFPKSKSKYIAILRHPVSQFESAFGYHEAARKLGLEKDSNPIETFFRNTKAFRRQFILDPQLLQLLQNPSIFDFGLDQKYFQNKTAVMRYINFIEDEFDLVLINEYYDESLILLKHSFCWDFEDIFYLKQKVRKTRASLRDEIKATITSWSRADLLLYNHFNKTLWRKISEAGPKFYEDLQLFREKKKIIEEACLREIEKGNIDIDREEPYPNRYLQMCDQMSRDTSRYLEFTKKQMQKKWVAVDTAYNLND